MNIIEAVKSGKRFREPGAKRWLSVHNGHICDDSKHHLRLFASVDVVSRTDWEIEEPRAEVTRSQVRKAVAGLLEDWTDNPSFTDELCRELGLEE